MKFPGFREFKINVFKDITSEDIVKYLSVDLVYSLRELTLGLRRLTFTENFQSFKITVTIAAGSETAIRNELDTIPTGRIILKSTSGDIVDGDTADNLNFVFLKNAGASSATVTAIFIR